VVKRVYISRQKNCSQASHDQKNMQSLLGEFPVSVDDKGRLMLPAALYKQMTAAERKKLVVNRGFETHLTLYPIGIWKKVTAELNKLNLYVRKNRDFVRRFHNGATELPVDGTNRILVPKTLLQYAAITKDAVLVAFSDRIELWSQTEYDKLMKDRDVDFAALAEDVMGKSKTEDGK
jgi:MraZ protein